MKAAHHESFGSRLLAARLHRDMSAVRLAREASLDPAEISNYERNTRRPGADNIRRLAIALDISADFLLGLTSNTRRISDSRERP